MDESLPVNAEFETLVSVRTKELKLITNELALCKHGSRAYQKIPRHMQRRQVSSHPKRLPRSIREKNRKEINDLIKDRKRPSRKYRRRPRNLSLTYAHRQQGIAWLETHIWHAKRFHMKTEWGYAMPHSPTACGYRSTLRARKETCLGMDTSYETFLQLNGDQDILLNGIGQLMSKDNLNKISKSFALDSQNWHNIMMHQPNRFPFNAIGDISLYWHPKNLNDDRRNMLLWVHPSILQEIITAICTIFELAEKTTEPILDEINVAIKCPKITTDYFPTYTSAEVELINMKGSLNKFTLFGPKAYTILQNVLKPINVKPTEPQGDMGDQVPKDLFWWKKFFTSEDNMDANRHQIDVWNSVGSNLPNKKTVYGFVTRDFRFLLPAKKVPFHQITSDSSTVDIKHFRRVIHPILDTSIREKVSSSMTSNDEINKLRSAQLVPGAEMDITEEESRIPVLILFNPGARKNPSWELILPSRWASVAWVVLHYHGVVAGGLKQQITLFQELFISSKPYLLPDSRAGEKYALLRAKDLETEYFKRPPKNRPNFTLIGTQYPFYSPWMSLVNSWCESAKDYYVLRDKTKLQALALYNSCKKRRKLQSKVNQKKLKLNSGSASSRLIIESNDSITPNDESALIGVRLIALNKGNIAPFSVVCMPTLEDLKSIQQNVQNSTWGKLENIWEEVHKDSNVEVRKQLKDDHEKLKLKLKRLRKKARKSTKICESITSSNEILSSNTELNQKLYDKIENYEKIMNEHWLISKTRKLQMCSRKIMGYVQLGDFSITNGRSCGRGYVVAKSLVELLPLLRNESDAQLKQWFVLIRNPTSMNYIWTRLEIIYQR